MAIRRKWFTDLGVHIQPLSVQYHIVLYIKLLLTADFNFHGDISHNPEAKLMLHALDMMCLIQHANDSTHRDGHILHRIISTECKSDFVEVVFTFKYISLSKLSICTPQYTIQGNIGLCDPMLSQYSEQLMEWTIINNKGEGLKLLETCLVLSL